MRIEELQNNLYIKETDSVEKYLLNIIQEYFRDSNTALEGSREYIIREAVNRLKEEMDYNALGVLSITLPNGEVRTGDVYISLEDLNGEPLISPKLSAFNVDFGEGPNTACEGNDPRLSNARKPIAHQHEISDVLNLEGILSNILNTLTKQGVLEHEHENKAVLDMLKYTGDNNEIDLTILDTLKPTIEDIFEQIKQNIIQYQEDTQDLIDEVNENLHTIEQEILSIKAYVLQKCKETLVTAKEYADSQILARTQELQTYIDETYVKKESIQALIDIAKNCYTFVNTERWLFGDIYDPQNTDIVLSLSEYTLNEFERRLINSNNLNNVIFNFALEYKIDNIYYRQPLPFIDSMQNIESFIYPLTVACKVNGAVQAVQSQDQIILRFRNNPSSFLDDNIINDEFTCITCDIYVKASVIGDENIYDEEELEPENNTNLDDPGTGE